MIYAALNIILALSEWVMEHKIDFSLVSSETIETALSRRIEDIRLSRNQTQAQPADQAGISRSTITRLVQDGKGISLDSFIRIMQALRTDVPAETFYGYNYYRIQNNIE